MKVVDEYRWQTIQMQKNIGDIRTYLVTEALKISSVYGNNS